MTDKRLYMRQGLLAMQRFELRLRVKAGSRRNAFIRQAAKAYEKSGEVPNNLRAAHERVIGDVLYKHYQLVMPYFGQLSSKELKARHQYIEKKRDTFLIRLNEWAVTRALNNASSIADTDMDDVRRKIQIGLDDGLGTAEIGRSIREVVNLTTARAATIARTETHAAATYAATEEAKQLQEEIGIVLVKEWLPTQDSRTRPEHLAMSSFGAIPLDEKFIVGGEAMDRPGDPSASAENVINCRCAIITTEKE
jgi:hypothetical protein